MDGKVKWVYMLAGGLIVLSVLVAGAFVFVVGSEAFSARTERMLPMLSQASQRLTKDTPWFPGDGDPPLDGHLEALAQALGITVEELEAAMETAREAAIEDGLALRGPRGEWFGEGDEAPDRPFRGRLKMPAVGGPFNQYLADALDISLDELEAAQEKARESMLSEALASGEIDSEQYERIQLMQTLQPYLAEAMQAAIQDAVQEALDAAVADGVITQTQAEQFKDDFEPGVEGERPHMPFIGPGPWMGP